MIMADNPFLQAARAGADALDRVRPGWRSEINPERLDMSDNHDDVLGQLFGNFSNGVDRLARGLKTDHNVRGAEFLTMRGFAVVAGASSLEECELLTQAWRQLIVV
jgi:hypothetical protein